MASRVAVTGLGVVTPAGIGMAAFWQSLLRSDRAVKPISLFDPGSFPCRIGGQLDDFSATKFVPKSYRKAVKVMARDIEIAVAAADLAIRDAGIVSRGIDPDNMTIEPGRLGCKIGAGLICTDLDELGMAVSTSVVDGKFDLRQWGRAGMGNLTPLWLLKYLPNMLACHVTIIHGAEGPSNTITCGDASCHLAIGEAGRLVAQGRADAVIAGGAESKLNPMGMLRQVLLKRLCLSGNDSPQQACRPFDARHDGTVVGEGGGVLIVEDMDRALRRGARIYAELVGFAAACDPEGMDVDRPTAGGLEIAVASAIRDAHLRPNQVDLIVAHGTAVPAEDRCECEAWMTAMGESAVRTPAVAITGGIGSLFAGGGAVQLAVAAMALHTQTIPPTANFTSCQDGCKLQFAPAARQKELTYAVTGTFSIGGQSAACVLKRHNP
jgi:3-oxoacyl-[acyl-carrier-protein] synthase II